MRKYSCCLFVLLLLLTGCATLVKEEQVSVLYDNPYNLFSDYAHRVEMEAQFFLSLTNYKDDRVSAKHYSEGYIARNDQDYYKRMESSISKWFENKPAEISAIIKANQQVNGSTHLIFDFLRNEDGKEGDKKKWDTILDELGKLHPLLVSNDSSQASLHTITANPDEFFNQDISGVLDEIGAITDRLTMIIGNPD
ncbi:MAG: hypothetical protein K0R57_3807 [Paenibacillaceae bacterium]|nr:hypothetical protein [Paenibacillaceae bacterium]